MFRSMFPGDMFAEMARLQRDIQQAFDLEPNIRGFARGGFPALNIGSTPEAVELFAFAPGMDPDSIEVHLERGVLTIAGERQSDLLGQQAQQDQQPQQGQQAQQGQQEKTTVHINERFAGSFRKVVSLPDDVDPDGVSAQYKDGVLHISVKRRQATQPRRISIH